MILNNLFKRLFNKVTFTKVIIIFIVGLFSRVFINYFYGVNVFVEYTNLISFYYYGVMSFIIVFISEVVSYFELDIFALFGNLLFYIFSLLRSFICICFSFFGHLLFGERYFLLGGDGSPSSKPFDFKKDRFILEKKRSGVDVIREPNQEHPDHRRIRIKPRRGDKFVSAGVLGLREEGARNMGFEYRSGSGGNVDHSEFNTSPLQKLKCRMLWITKYQFGHEYNNYYEFKNSLSGNISIRQVVKNIFK